jgi:PIN domain nuclease of toxin-antitoxin system
LTVLLLDTHALLWAFTDPQRLPVEVRAVLEGSSRVLVSAVSIYELAFKHRFGKLDEAQLLLNDLDRDLASKSVDRLEVTLDHALAAGRLDTQHRDLFDRLLIAQALVEDFELVSNEKLFDQYGVRRL